MGHTRLTRLVVVVMGALEATAVVDALKVAAVDIWTALVKNKKELNIQTICQ